jgi:filamentous hemagglutinin family protein
MLAACAVSSFSVLSANTAHFDNALTTTNVIGRVTGSNISNIDGTLRTTPVKVTNELA